MKKEITLAHVSLCAVVIILLGICSMTIGVLTGGQFLDGLAGGTRINTSAHDLLINGGLIIGFIGFVLLLLTIMVLILRVTFKWVFKK